jgi:hypothetical protein
MGTRRLELLLLHGAPQAQGSAMLFEALNAFVFGFVFVSGMLF